MEQSRQLIKLEVSSSGTDSYSLLLDDFNHALSINAFGDQILRESMLSVSSQMLQWKDFDREGALKFIETTLRESEKGLALNRHNVEYLTDVILFFKKVAVYEKSYIARTEALINECKGLNPEYQRLDMIMTDVLILKKDYEAAFINVKKTLYADQQNDDKQLQLAVVAILTSREDVAERALDNVKKIRVARSSYIASGRVSVFSLDELYQFSQTYRTVEDYHKTIYYLREIISILSDKKKLSNLRPLYRKPAFKAKHHLEIAETYMKLGERGNALKEVEMAVELDPLNLAEKAAEFVREYHFR
jgi:tetratricopeptide (TPR) repeat protein